MLIEQGLFVFFKNSNHTPKKIEIEHVFQAELQVNVYSVQSGK